MRDKFDEYDDMDIKGLIIEKKKKKEKKRKKAKHDSIDKIEKRFDKIYEKYGVTEESILQLADQLEQFVEAVDFVTIAHHQDVQEKMSESIDVAYEMIDKLRSGKIEDVWKKQYHEHLREIIKGEMVDDR